MYISCMHLWAKGVSLPLPYWATTEPTAVLLPFILPEIDEKRISKKYIFEPPNLQFHLDNQLRWSYIPILPLPVAPRAFHNNLNNIWVHPIMAHSHLPWATVVTNEIIHVSVHTNKQITWLRTQMSPKKPRPMIYGEKKKTRFGLGHDAKNCAI